MPTATHRELPDFSSLKLNDKLAVVLTFRTSLKSIVSSGLVVSGCAMGMKVTDSTLALVFAALLDSM